MPATIELTVDGRPGTHAVDRVFNAGYTGRDQAVVRAHIDELAEQGIGGPGQVPTLFSVPSYMVVQDADIEATHPRTSGEAEWALLYRGEDSPPLITVASDHTDRRLEAHDVEASKQISPDVLGTEAWDLDALGEETDALVLRSLVEVDGEWVTLQEGTLAELISPREWIERLRALGRLAPGTLVLGGTLPMREAAKQFSPHWRVSLVRPDGGSIDIEYTVRELHESIL